MDIEAYSQHLQPLLDALYHASPEVLTWEPAEQQGRLRARFAAGKGFILVTVGRHESGSIFLKLDDEVGRPALYIETLWDDVPDEARQLIEAVYANAIGAPSWPTIDAVLSSLMHIPPLLFQEHGHRPAALNLTVRRGTEWAHLKPGQSIRLAKTPDGEEPIDARLELVLACPLKTVPRSLLKHEHDPNCRTLGGLRAALAEIYSTPFTGEEIVTAIGYRLAGGPDED